MSSFTLKIIQDQKKKFHWCLNEILEMVYYTQSNLLHKRTEKMPSQNKFTLLGHGTRD